ncbi:hypothetical protein Hdeb2414_s0034g00725981 [Helianthus debilis subsp. tardiflorus]
MSKWSAEKVADQFCGRTGIAYARVGLDYAGEALRFGCSCSRSQIGLKEDLLYMSSECSKTKIG